MTKENTREKSYEKATIKPLENSTIEISGSIPEAIWTKYREKAVKEISQSVKIDGFRKGNVPENILVGKVGEMTILEEMAELAMPSAYLDIIIDNKIDAIGKPTIQVTKLAAGNPIEFKITTAVVPSVELPDYKKIAKEAVKEINSEDISVTEKDMEEAIIRIRKSRVSHEGHDHDSLTAEEHEKEIEKNMPELTDDFVKTLGEFKDIPDFKEKLKVMLIEQKKDEANEKRRIKIADALDASIKVSLPEILIDSEVGRIESQFKNDIERMGVKFDDYLKHAKKTIEEIRKDWRPNAEKKAKLQLVLNAIAVKENIKADEKEIEAEVNHIVSHYKEADRERASIYAETVLTNEKVFKFLETL